MEESSEYVVVPREPTTEMIQAAYDALAEAANARTVWAAMVNAYVKPKKPDFDEVK